MKFIRLGDSLYEIIHHYLNDLPTGYIDKIFAENFLIRDVIICLLREKLTELL